MKSFYPIREECDVHNLRSGLGAAAKQATVKELRNACKVLGVKGYSNKKKAWLIEHCGAAAGKPVVKETGRKAKSSSRPSVADLKRMCKERGVKGYSNKKKAWLLQHCMGDEPKVVKRAVAKKKKKAVASGDLELIGDRAIIGPRHAWFLYNATLKDAENAQMAQDYVESQLGVRGFVGAGGADFGSVSNKFRDINQFRREAVTNETWGFLTDREDANKPVLLVVKLDTKKRLPTDLALDVAESIDAMWEAVALEVADYDRLGFLNRGLTPTDATQSEMIKATQVV